MLGLREGRDAALLRSVPMSAPRTYADTRAALVAAGQRVVNTVVLRDVDTVADADAVAGQAPDGQSARMWRHLRAD